MKTLTYLITLFIFSLTANAQVWNTVGPGLPGNWDSISTGLASYHYNGRLYVAYSEFSTATTSNTTYVKRWDGSVWQSYPAIPGYHVKDIAADIYGIYVTGSGDVNSVAFYTFDGSSWIANSPAGFSGEGHTLEIANGDLVIGGNFLAGGSIQDICSYDGSSFNSYPALNTDVQSITDIHKFNSELFISCAANTSSTYNGFLKLNGSSWDNPVQFLQGTSTSTDTFSIIFEYQNELYVVGKNWNNSVVYQVDADTLKFRGDVQHKVTDAQNYNNLLYLSGDNRFDPFHFTLGLSTFNGNTVSPIFGGPLGNASLDTLNGELYVFSKFTRSIGGVNFEHCFRTARSLLNGFAFLDLNGDCFMNSNEPAIANASINLNNWLALTADDGYYSFDLSPGTYSFGQIGIPSKQGKNLTNNCSLPSQISLGGNQTVTTNLGFSNPVNTDMIVQITGARGPRARHGFTGRYKLEVINAGNATQANANVELTLPPSCIFVSSTPAPASQTGNKLEFNFLNVQPLESRSVELWVTVDHLQNVIGDTLKWYTNFTNSFQWEADSTDNQDSLIQLVVGAYDPNDKHASTTQIFPSTDRIDYHVNFQNTGNDTAFKVTVVDTLDLSLPINSVIINSTSHAYNLSVVNNVLIWEFDNIMLPDSGVDYYGSQGYLNFSVNISPGLAVGDTVKNEAQIYFDYQPAVHTNIAKTAVILNDISVKDSYVISPSALSFYPNPANNEINIKNEGDNEMELRILDLSGKHLDTIQLQAYEQKVYTVQHLKAGIYLLQSTTETYRLVISD